MLYFVSVSNFSGEKSDPTKPAVYLSPIVGNKLPERARVCRLEYASKKGLKVGASYAVQLESYAGDNGYTNYRITPIRELTLMDILDLQRATTGSPSALPQIVVEENPTNEEGRELPF